MQLDETKKIKHLTSYNLLAIILGLIVGFLCKGSEDSIWGIEQIRTVGELVVMSMTWLAIPLVFFSVIDVISKLKGARQHGRVIAKVIGAFAFTSFMACVIGIVTALCFHHLGLFQSLPMIGGDFSDIRPQLYFMKAVSNITVSDLVDAVLKENFFMVLAFSLLIGFSVAKAGEEGEMFGKLVTSINFIIKKMISFLVRIAPVGVFAMTVNLVFEFNMLHTWYLFWLALALYIAYLLHMLITYVFELKFWARVPVLKFFRYIFPAMSFAMTSTSSLACVPVAEKVCESLGARQTVTDLVIPFGYVANRDGMAIYLAICTIFFASISGVALSIWQLILLAAVVLLVVFGAAGVPHAGLIMLSMVMRTLDLDVAPIIAIYAIDKFFDIGRTCLNVTGDLVTVVCAEKWCRDGDE